jgi:hypothetical protein
MKSHERDEAQRTAYARVIIDRSERRIAST